MSFQFSLSLFGEVSLSLFGEIILNLNLNVRNVLCSNPKRRIYCTFVSLKSYINQLYVLLERGVQD